MCFIYINDITAISIVAFKAGVFQVVNQNISSWVVIVGSVDFAFSLQLCWF